MNKTKVKDLFPYLIFHYFINSLYLKEWKCSVYSIAASLFHKSLEMFLFYFSVTIVPIFPPLLSSALPTPLSHLQSLPCVLYTCSLMSLPLLFPLSSSPDLSGHCQFVLYFHVSGLISLICLFCWLGSTYRWDDMVFAFTTWLIRIYQHH